MKIKIEKYKKILNLKKKFKFSNFELITNYGLFSGDTNLFKTLTIFQLIYETRNIKGNIIEFGIHKGNTSLLIKKIIDIYKIKKKLYLFDHFKGLIHFEKKDTVASRKFNNLYSGKKNQIKSFINFFKFKNIKIVDKNAINLEPGYFKNVSFSFAYFDLDLYLPTLKALNSINKNMSVGSFIVFDQGSKKLWAERKAINEFIKKNKNYKKIYIYNKKRQPDIILKKIKV